MSTASNLVAEWGLSVVGAMVVLVVGLWIAKRIRSGVKTGLGRQGLDPTLIPFVSSLIYWGLVAFVLIAVLGIFGIPTASFIAVLGAAGLAVGLALQGTLSNFASGVMILIFRPFSVGNWVEVAGVAGSVREIGIFSTVLHTGDNVKVVVPNSQVYGQTVKNFSANDTRRIDLIIGVSYDDDLQVAQDTILEVLSGDERILGEPAPTVAVHELGDSSVDFVVRPWCNASDYWPLRWHLLRQLKERLEAAGCSIPYPQRDLHLFRQGDGDGGN
ncbi:MAG: mechanosensitive ion channel family protein [Gemmatimonadales bacterium]|nr:MAG: mechanosensitive ion channel family protein [Gemmatimonadales bacterium]